MKKFVYQFVGLLITVGQLHVRNATAVNRTCENTSSYTCLLHGRMINCYIEHAVCLHALYILNTPCCGCRAKCILLYYC